VATVRKPFVENIINRGREKRLGETNFDEREKCGEFHTLFPMLLEQASKFF
jgi:hypothetical protein